MRIGEQPRVSSLHVIGAPTRKGAVRRASRTREARAELRAHSDFVCLGSCCHGGTFGTTSPRGLRCRQCQSSACGELQQRRPLSSRNNSKPPRAASQSRSQRIRTEQPRSSLSAHWHAGFAYGLSWHAAAPYEARESPPQDLQEFDASAA